MGARLVVFVLVLTGCGRVRERHQDAGGTGGSPANVGGSAGMGGDGGDRNADPDADAGAPWPCTSSGSLHENQVAVRGTIRGSGVDAVLCRDGVGTVFLGPGGSAQSPYVQVLETTTESTDPVQDGFLFSAPDDVIFASLSGSAGATTSEPGTYRSADNGGWFALELSFPIPPGIVCPPFPEPCGPDCEGEGEAGVCRPSHPKWRYSASGSDSGSAEEAPRGTWELTLTSVSPHIVTGTLINHSTHGRLTAALVNDLEASDTVELDLEF
jgi:hypothetical protein